MEENLTQKYAGSGIRDPGKKSSRIRIQGVKTTGFRIRIRNTAFFRKINFKMNARA
jgi:hypothetical protein